MEFYPVQKVRNGFLSVMPMPGKKGDLKADIQELALKNVDSVVSFLEPKEAEKLGIAQEAALCETAGIEFLNFAIIDHTTPANLTEAALFIKELETRLEEGKHLVLHCKGGTGRTGTFAGALLHRSGMPAEEVFQVLTKARGKKMPATEEQQAWALQSFE